MSLLNGLREAMINPLFEAVNEADIDADFEFECALEAVVDKHIELTEEDYDAIMDDDNPDNIVADITAKDESVSKIANDAIDDDLKALESMLDELIALEEDQEIPEVEPETIETTESKCAAATEMDDDDIEYDEDDDNEEDDDSDEVVSLDSLLNSIFES